MFDSVLHIGSRFLMAVIFQVMVLGRGGELDVCRCYLKNYRTHFAGTIIVLLFQCRCSRTEAAEAK